MRLLNAETRKLESFLDAYIPPYAILSHTWGADEVTFQEIHTLRAENKLGYRKIKYACDQALLEGFAYIWVDTCCIDKTSSAELSEAINSMFKWYRDAGICYAYLYDVPGSHGQLHDVEVDAAEPSLFGDSGIEETSYFSRSWWFTRGWTLQELIAPRLVSFYGDDWTFLGTKSQLRMAISKITGIDVAVLDAPSPANLNAVSIATKMFWASKRQTSREEDIAYCLLGLVGVNMPLLYGEGQSAFIRLQEEIIKTSDDESIFAWDYDYQAQNSSSPLLAPSPRCFRKGNRIVRTTRGQTREPYSLTNKGLRIRLPMVIGANGFTAIGALACRYEDDLRGPIAIKLISEAKHSNENPSEDTWDVEQYPISHQRLDVVPVETADRAIPRTILVSRKRLPWTKVPSLSSSRRNVSYFVRLSEELRFWEGLPSRYWNRHDHVSGTMLIPKDLQQKALVGIAFQSTDKTDFGFGGFDFGKFDFVLSFGSGPSTPNGWVTLGVPEEPVQSLDGMQVTATAGRRNNSSRITVQKANGHMAIRASIREEFRMGELVFVVDIICPDNGDSNESVSDFRMSSVESLVSISDSGSTGKRSLSITW
jgi:hypothetical protein